MPFKKGQKAHNFNDLTGLKFNMLTVESFYGIKNQQSYWICKCDCGNEKILPNSSLKRTKSCGCAMKMHYSDLSGFENSDIAVLSFAERRNNRIYWNCKCKHCGNIIQKEGGNIKKGLATCKCIHMKRIGKSNSKPFRDSELYSIWNGMKTRCYNQNEKSYKYYGGRGIIICEEWKNDFMKFYEWALNNGYKTGLSIERKNVNGNYEPCNCIWMTMKEQAKNKTNTIYAELNGEKKRLLEWCEIMGLNPKTVYSRIYQSNMTPEEALLYKRK